MKTPPNNEVKIRLKAIGRWADYACDGKCDSKDALDAITELATAIRQFLPPPLQAA